MDNGQHAQFGSGTATVVLALLVAMAFAVPVAAASTAGDTVTRSESPSQFTAQSENSPEQPAFVVHLREDGSARVVTTITFDLESDSDREAFAKLEEDGDARASLGDTFAERMSNVAATAEQETGREMAVDNPKVSVTTPSENLGVVALSVEWTGLATVEAGGDRLVVTEPFASGMQLDRAVTVQWPDRYEVASVSPDPANTSENAATWKNGTDLSGFELVVESDETSGTGQTESPNGETAPGLGIFAAIVALAIVGGSLRRRRS